MKKILFIILFIGSIFLISDKVNAAVVGINTLSYDIYQNSNLVSQGSIDTQSGLSINNVTYYNIHNPSTSNSVDIKGVNANGSYFIFYVRLYPSSESLSSNDITTINGYVRDNYSNVYNCNVNTFMVSDQKNTDLSYFSFTCDLTSLGDKQIYSFGFNYNSLTKIDDFRISNFYFYNAQSGESGVIGSINNSSQNIINNQDKNQQQTNDLLNGVIGGANQNKQDIIKNQTDMANGIIGGANQNKQDIIDNQDKNQQQTNEKLDGINNSINDSKVDSNTGNDFFNNFNTSDNGGISSIVTAPLVAINSMLDNTCKPMTTTYKGKEIKLECGTSFWNQANTVQDYLNWFEGGILVYLIIRKLFKLIESLKNPDEDRVEVMNL